MSSNKLATEQQELAYLAPPRNLEEQNSSNSMYFEETTRDKFKRKFKENPFVPVGMGLTTVALTYGLWQMKSGNRRMSQIMMRSRIMAQGLTVVAIIGGVMYGAGSKKK